MARRCAARIAVLENDLLPAETPARGARQERDLGLRGSGMGRRDSEKCPPNRVLRQTNLSKMRRW